MKITGIEQDVRLICVGLAAYGYRDRYPLPVGFTIHGLRHTTMTLLQKDCDVDARTTMSITGHKTM